MTTRQIHAACDRVTETRQAEERAFERWLRDPAYEAYAPAPDYLRAAREEFKSALAAAKELQRTLPSRRGKVYVQDSGHAFASFQPAKVVARKNRLRSYYNDRVAGVGDN